MNVPTTALYHIFPVYAIEKVYWLHILRTSFIKTANKVHLEQYRGDRYEVEL